MWGSGVSKAFGFCCKQGVASAGESLLSQQNGLGGGGENPQKVQPKFLSIRIQPQSVNFSSELLTDYDFTDIFQLYTNTYIY